MKVKERPPYAAPLEPQEKIAHEPQNPSFLTYVHVVRKRKWLFLSMLAFCLFVAFFINATQTPVYRASTELVLEVDNPAGGGVTSPAQDVMRDPTFLMTQKRLIRGPHLAERVVESLSRTEDLEKLLKAYRVRFRGKRGQGAGLLEEERVALASAIRRSLSAEQLQPGARILRLSSEGFNPALTTRAADASSDAYIAMNHESQIASFRKSFSMFSKSLTEIREKIKTGEIAVQKVQSEIELLEALQIYGEKFPKVIELRQTIPALTKKLELGVQNLQQMEIGQREDLIAIVMKPHVDVAGLAAIETDLYNLKPILEQEVNANRDMYNSIYRKLQEVELAGTSGVWLNIKVLEPAALPREPIRPNKRMNLLLGLTIGFFLGLGLVFFQEYLDNSIRSMEDVQGYLGLVPLGLIPEVEFEVDGEGEAKDEAPLLARHSGRAFWNTSNGKVPLYVAEAYRIVRTNLSMGLEGTSLKVIQVTSALKGEGKTTTTCNLGISLAQNGFRTLLVDADMRRPALHKSLEVEGVRRGLRELLASDVALDEVLEPTQTPNLSLLSAGSIPSNPSELLSSRRMKDLIEEVRQRFDIVLIDSPPVISVADAPILASRVDGTILVTRSGYVPRNLCLQAKRALETVNGKVIGCVLNNVLTEHHPYYNYRYYKNREYYYYGDEAKRSKDRKKRAVRNVISSLERLKVLRESAGAYLLRQWHEFAEALREGVRKRHP